MTQQTNTIQKVIRKASSNRKLYVFLFCIILSILFWLLNALGKKSATQVSFDVTYFNQPTDKVVLNELPNRLDIKIKGLGYDLMAYKLRLRRPVVKIDLARLEGIEDGGKTNTLASTSFSTFITNQFGEQIEVKSIFPDSIRFEFDKRIEKKVKIIPATELKFKRQFQLFGDVIVKPAITTVSGPASILDTLSEIYTETLVGMDIEETTTESIGFDASYAAQKILCNPEKVILHIPVEKFTETTVMVAVNSINVPDSIEIKAIPQEVEVKFLIPLSKMANVGSAKFVARIDYNQINDNFNHKLKVELTDFPSYIQSVTLNPGKVEYILKKRK